MNLKERILALLLTIKAIIENVHRQAWSYTLQFVYDKKAESKSITVFVMEAIGIVIAVMMLPPVADTVLSVNTSAWTFTGAAACITMMYLIPFIYIVTVIVHIVKSAIEG